MRNDACCSEEGASEEKNAFFLAFWASESDALLSSDKDAELSHSDSDSFSTSELSLSDSSPVSSDVANGSSSFWSSSALSGSRTAVSPSLGSSSS